MVSNISLYSDFCVGWSVIDALKAGFNVYLVSDAVAGIAAESTAQMINRVQQVV